MAQSALRALMQGGPAPSGMASAQTAIQNAAQRPQPKPMGQQMADVLGGVALPLSAVPFVGDVTGLAADAAMYANYPEERTLGNFGLTMAGMLPGIPAAAAMRTAKGGLDMSQAARMQRAVDQGFHTNMPLYHATNYSFDAFEVPERGFLKYGKGVYASPNPKYSDRYIQLEGGGLEPEYMEGANIMPVYARGKIATEKDFEAARQEMLSEGIKPAGYIKEQAEIKRRLQDKGFDGLNMFGTEVVIYDPANIRSVNAAFDPTNRGSANLMAGVMGGAVGLSALRQLIPQQEQE